MHINGVLYIVGTFQGKSKTMDCLVSDDLQNEIIVAGHDASAVGAVHITPDEEDEEEGTTPNPQPRCAVLRPNPEPCKQVREFTKRIIAKYPILSDKINSEPMKGFPDMVINMKEGFKPPEPVTTAAGIPHHFQGPTKKTMDELIKRGIIREVEFSNNPKYCSRALMVAKPGGIEKGVRLVVDQSNINKGVVRPTHPFTSGNTLLQMIPASAVVFAKFDALSGYFQIPLAEESRHITQFIHKRGTFEFCRAPMGLNASGDEWCKRSDAALANLEGILKLVDDILIYGSNYEELFRRIEAVLDRCTKHNITLSRKKIEIGDSVTFGGFHVSKDGYSPTKERTEAIEKFPEPQNVTGVRSFLGLANGLAHFVPDYAQASQALRHLLKKQTSWRWADPQKESFKKVKEILTGNLVLKNFDPSLETQVVTDASRVGTGFCLLQRHKNKLGGTDNWHMVQCGSKALNGAESRYAVCEIECLAVLHALRKCRYYLAGMDHFDLITDHRSLVGVFKKDLSTIENVRLRRFREHMGEFNFTVTWTAGRLNTIADCLSRYPVAPADHVNDSPQSPESSVCVCKAIQNPNKKKQDPLLEPILEAARDDEEYQDILTAIRENLKRADLPEDHKAHKFAQVWKDISIHSVGLLILDNQRIIVPEKYRETLVEKLHKSHCGQSKTEWRARRDYWWPGYNKSIEKRIIQCTECLAFRASQRIEPIINQNTSKGPMEVVGIDLYESKGQNFLAMVDQYSGYPWAGKLSSINAKSVIEFIQPIFDQFGNPEWIIHDQGRQFMSGEFQTFLRGRGIQSSPSTAYHPRSNGLSEACVKNVKHLFEKSHRNMAKFSENLQALRDTPTNKNGITPAQMFLGRRIRTGLPSLAETTLDITTAEKGAADRKESNIRQFGKRSTRALPPLEIGDRVIVQEPCGKDKGKWLKQGIVSGLKKGRNDGEVRSYMIHFLLKYGGGARYVNRRHVIHLPDDAAPQEADVSDPDEEEADTEEAGAEENEAEESESDPEEQQIIPDIENVPEEIEDQRPPVTALEPQLRRSERQIRHTDCQSCIGCKKIECVGIPSTTTSDFPSKPNSAKATYAAVTKTNLQNGSSSFHSKTTDDQQSVRPI